MNDTNWRDKAMCAGHVEADWFPDVTRGRAGSRPAFRTALDVIGRYCDHCPVRDACGAEAERLDAELSAVITGIWGGALRYRSRKNTDTTETSHVLTPNQLRAHLGGGNSEPLLPVTARCSCCDWESKPRRDGTIRFHTQPGASVMACPGSGEPPAPVQAAS